MFVILCWIIKNIHCGKRKFNNKNSIVHILREILCLNGKKHRILYPVQHACQNHFMSWVKYHCIESCRPHFRKSLFIIILLQKTKFIHAKYHLLKNKIRSCQIFIGKMKKLAPENFKNNIYLEKDMNFKLSKNFTLWN